MDLSIIIVSWNICGLLKQCLESVLVDLPGDKSEIIVVDNASSDGTPTMLREFFPAVKLIENGVNVGFGRANNQGIQASGGRYVLLLNPDTMIKKRAIATLLEFLENTPQAAAAGPRLFNPDGSFQHSCSPAPTLASEFKRLFHLPGVRPDGYYAMEKWSINEPRTVEVMLGACMLLRRDALEQVGLFDEDFFMYSEEVDLCQRIRMKGWALYWVPQAEVIHYGGQSTGQLASEMFINLYQSKVHYFRKHFGERESGWYQLLLRLVAISRLIASLPVWLLFSNQRKQQKVLLNNYRHLLFVTFNNPSRI